MPSAFSISVSTASFSAFLVPVGGVNKLYYCGRYSTLTLVKVPTPFPYAVPSDCELKYVKTIGTTGLFAGCVDRSIYVIGNDSTYGYLGTNVDLAAFKKLSYTGRSIVTHGISLTIGATIISQTCLDDEVRVIIKDDFTCEQSCPTGFYNNYGICVLYSDCLGII